MDLAYLTNDMSEKAAGAASADEAITEEARLRTRLEDAPRGDATKADRRPAKEGGR